VASPSDLKARLPVPERVAERVRQTRAAIGHILHGRDRQRLVVLAGPCSIHDRGAALEYGRRLAEAGAVHADALVVVMRSYFEKPRTTLGWKGMLVDPQLDDSCDLERGLESSRELLIELGQLGVACGSELLGPLAPGYLDDLLSWAGIGARTVESQPHRELASGLSLPVGVKNGTDGRTATAFEALIAIREPHSYLGLDPAGGPAVVRTPGNGDAHVVLRGGGGAGNADAKTLGRIAREARNCGLARPLLVDCSHGNSAKDHRKQAAVCRGVLEQLRTGQRAIAGIALESHLRAGRQTLQPGAKPLPGLSITDACIGWGETAELLNGAADTVRSMR
jgi:3-deoxy-7-phosphoheptulonate synthase